MPVASAHPTCNQGHRSLRGLESIDGSQDFAFLDQPWPEADDSLSQITASTSCSRRECSERLGAISESENACGDGQQTLLHFVNTYSLHFLVAAIVYLFLFEVAVRLPFLLALAFAIPSIHALFTPIQPTNSGFAHDDGEEVLFRRSSIITAVPGEPVAQYKATGTSHPVAFPGLILFSPSTWFSRATDSVDFRYKRLRLHTTFRESMYQPRRTFREALEDTVPRVLESWTAFILRNLFYQITSRITMFIVGRMYKGMTGEEMDVNAYIINVLRFYWGWAAGMTGVTSYAVKWVVLKWVEHFALFFMWLGRQTRMFVGSMHDTVLEYEDSNTVQF